MARPPRLDAGSREKILEVAEALFARRGFSGVGMREVAESAGLGKSSLFHHFRSKAQLYFAVMERVLARLEAALDPVLASGAPPLVRLETSVDALIDALAQHPGTARLLLRGLFEDDDFAPEDEALPEAQETERRLQALVGGLHGVLRDGCASGDLRPVSPGDTLQTLIGATVYHFASGEFGDSVIGRPVYSAEAVARRKREVRNLLHHGLAAAPGGSRRGETP